MTMTSVDFRDFMNYLSLFIFHCHCRTIGFDPRDYDPICQKCNNYFYLYTTGIDPRDNDSTGFHGF